MRPGAEPPGANPSPRSSSQSLPPAPPPPGQPSVGLTLAASWLSRRRRLLFLFVGVGLLWFVVMMGVVSMSSPYLGPAAMRTVISSILTNGHLIIGPIIFWLILVGIPPATVTTCPLM